MSRKRIEKTRIPSFLAMAEKALKIAVAKALADHRRVGHPIYVWRNGKVVRVPARRIVVPRYQ